MFPALRPLLTFAVLVLLLSGCSAPATETVATVPSSRAPPPPAPEPDVTPELGSISGVVVDDEQLPVSRASVTVVETTETVVSDVAGGFTFNGLEPGPYVLQVTRVGYSEATRKVEVLAGEVTSTDLVIAPLAFTEPYVLTIPRVAHVKASWLYVTHLIWPRNNNSGLNGLVCEPCRFTLHHDPSPQAVMTETHWKSGTTNPVLNNQVWIQHMRNITEADGDGEVIVTGYWSDRESHLWTDEQAAQLIGVAQHDFWVEGDLLGVNLEHQVEVYTSFAYHSYFQTEFSALPPE